MRRSYAHFCKCGQQLDVRFEALGGYRIADRRGVAACTRTSLALHCITASTGYCNLILVMALKVTELCGLEGALLYGHCPGAR